jgi:hypothetical protein
MKLFGHSGFPWIPTARKASAWWMLQILGPRMTGLSKKKVVKKLDVNKKPEFSW